ncbi:hypothetical protein GJ744_011929 [Endocarpon pusillum]|uniref:Uncharacterized protein n=1 Tax=Endocarpon pusillum TaxID=364733 RepID=A0A8H7ATP2_9EURO|nr:hypothetical protein GJ744_011929 [Endocarpon pusillum]
MANLDEMENIPKAIGRYSEGRIPQKAHGRAVLARANKTQRRTTESGTENESSDDEVADDEDDDDESDEDDDGDDESDQPAAFAPSCGHTTQTIHKAGRLAEYRRMFHSEDPIMYEDPHDLFGGVIEDDDDDDEFYRAVDDISDEDDQSEGLFQPNGAGAGAAANFVIDQSSSTFAFPDPEHEADFILDQVDGLSAYGFGDDIDSGDGSGEFSAPSEDGDLPTVPERHVHFGSDIEKMNAYGKSTSPSLTRALLPSAMPFEHENHIYAPDNTYQTSRHKGTPTIEEAYDSDATEVLSGPPTPPQRTTSVTNVTTLEAEYATFSTPTNVSSGKKGKRSSRRRRGPPRGIFNVDQDKSWAILDSTGKKILQIPAANTNRHAWLDEMSQSTSTPSNSASPLNPSLGLQKQGLSSGGVLAAKTGVIINTAIPDVMMAGLNSINSIAEVDHGQTIGPPEAFYSNRLQLVGGDYAISPEPESDVYDEEAMPITRKPGFPLHEFLEDLGDDESDDGKSELPLYAPADDNLTGDNDALFGHLNNMNVTAFRRSADPISASRTGISYSYDVQMSPIADSTFALPSVPVRIPTSSHKRKTSSTPYQDEKIYGDVTPVERKVINLSKRRKMTT